MRNTGSSFQGPAKHWSVHAAELISIYFAITIAEEAQRERNRHGRTQPHTVTIVSDCKSALQAIETPSTRPGQHIVRSIHDLAESLKREHRLNFRLQWIPGHSGNAGNDAADKLAKEAVSPEQSHQFLRLVSAQKKVNRERVYDEWEREWRSSSEKGKHLRRIDEALPSTHARRLYDPLPRNRSYLLMQLRSGHCWLASHGKERGHREGDKFEGGARETVVHVLVDCPKLRDLRQQLRTKIGDAFHTISTMLGGQTNQDQGKPKRRALNREVLDAVFDFAEASGRFQARE